MLLAFPDTLSTQFLDFSSQNFSGTQTVQSLNLRQLCASNWTDPTSHILNSLNELASRLSVSASMWPFRDTNPSAPPQLLTMQQTTNINIYQSEYPFLVANTVLTLAFKKVFDAPLSLGPGSNAPLDKLIKIMGTREVEPGEVENHARSPVLRMRGKIATPRKGHEAESRGGVCLGERPIN